MPLLDLTKQLLLEFMRSDIEVSNISPVGSKKIDWLVVAQNIPSLYLKTKSLRENLSIPQKTKDKIREVYFWQVARNERFKHDIAKLAKAFAAIGIELIFLKGASLLTTVYSADSELRTMDDIDVLIRRDDIKIAENILGDMGYKTHETCREREIFLREHFHFEYSKEEIDLELHWDIGEQWHWDIVESKDAYKSLLFKLSEQITIRNTEIRVLRPECNIFVMCFHFDRDLFLQYRFIYSPFVYLSKYAEGRNKLVYHSLRFFYEIKKMLKFYGDSIDWNNLFRLADLAKKEYEVFTLLFLAKKIAKADIPEAVLKKMKQNIFVRLYVFLTRLVKYDDFTKLFLINRLIYRVMLVSLYIYYRKYYLLIMRFAGERV